MKWPWQPAKPEPEPALEPGMVWVDDQELIRLLRSALRAADLERETRAVEHGTQLLRVSTRAQALLNDHPTAGASDASAVRGAVLEQLPLTQDGDLHEAAFLALVDAQVWRRREQWVANELERGKA